MAPWTTPVSLEKLPYDLLLNIAQHLDLLDIRALQLTCKFFHYVIQTRPVHRHLALGLLRRCRALPLTGFQRLSDLSTEQLIHTVNKAAHLERSWLTRTPKRATETPYLTASRGTRQTDSTSISWYKVVGTPPGEQVDWLSPITASYSLCATKSGKVVCWDVQRDVELAEWNPGERWELWKCRVEFEKRTVYFTMAKVLSGTQDDKIMEFDLMQIHFPRVEENELCKPTFSHLRSFKTAGLVMNVFLLDPSARLLCGFVWMLGSNTIALYVLLDWDVEEYIFIDTDIQCTASSNWSCILYEGDIVIHSEEAGYACQHFFPLATLRQFSAPSNSKPEFIPRVSTVLKPTRTLTRDFTFPVLPPSSYKPAFPPHPDEHIVVVATPAQPFQLQLHHVPHIPTMPAPGAPPPNPFQYPLWYPESAHFVRQWWPTLPSVPRLSCTVVLLAQHDHVTHCTKYVVSQHYFRVPLYEPDETPDTPIDAEDALMRMWYVSEPFEIVCVVDTVEDEEDEPGTPNERSRPLLAVDFGHAVWIEYIDALEEGDQQPENEPKRLQFVSFPSVSLGEDGRAVRTSLGRPDGRDTGGEVFEMEGVVKTLEIPEDLDLDSVETINIDQSQGAVILSVKEGKIFILCYE
ncbi:hypothetical protein BV25DRAFT_1827075 [Artomyces pyxidatus]|uniref:Uncharacterized protein n=1 Tax=Artomyces pyxidatus TaxID=48021 RepID=A0ACB8SXT0_9AGAM|nr:hypothetical protein BV25DRAFT_1827075 [Artomyces pyxidatus]